MNLRTLRSLAFPQLTPRVTLGIVIATSALSLLFRSAIPISAGADNVGDDALFVHLATHILDGQWLGTYDIRTLIKGTFYPIFVAASYVLGLPLKTAEQMAYLAAAGGAAWLLWRLSASRALAVVAFVLLAFNPALWHPSLARVLRDALYVSVSLAVFSVAALVLFDTQKSATRRLMLLFGFGILFAAYWLTREESVWLYPALAVLALGAVALRFLTGSKDRIAVLKAASVSIAIEGATVAAGFVLLAGTVATLNYVYYGVFLTNEIREGTFASAYGALMRIEPDHWQRYEAFPDDVAEKAYAVSPAALELKPHFDAEAKQWTGVNCSSMKLSPCPSGPGGWLIWALRDAIAGAGYYRNGAAGQAFQTRLASEINAACDSGRLRCLPARSTMAPPFRREYIAPTLASTGSSLGVLLGWRGRLIGAGASRGSPEQLQLFRQIVGRVSPTKPQEPATLDQVLIAAMRPLSSAYYFILQTLVVTGALGVGLTAMRLRAMGSNAALLTVAMAAAVAVMARCMLVAYIDATSFTAVQMLYLVEASPFLMLFALVGTYLGLRSLRDMRSRDVRPGGVASS